MAVKNKKNNHFLILAPIVFFVCLLVGIALGNLILFLKKNKPSQATTTYNQSVKEELKTPQIEEETYYEYEEYDKWNENIAFENPTKITQPSWATYTNATYDFSFQFPSKWFLNKEEMSLGTHLPDLVGPGVRHGITIYVFEQNQEQPLRTLIEEIREEYKINGINGDPQEMPATGNLSAMYYLPVVTSAGYTQGVFAQDNKGRIIKIFCDYCENSIAKHVAETLQSPRKHSGR